MPFSNFFSPDRKKKKILINYAYSIIHLMERGRGHFGLLGDRCLGASCAEGLGEAPHSRLPRAGQDHPLRAPLLA